MQRSPVVSGNQPLRLHFPCSAASRPSRRPPNACTLRQEGLSRGAESRGTMLPDADETPGSLQAVSTSSSLIPSGSSGISDRRREREREREREKDLAFRHPETSRLVLLVLDSFLSLSLSLSLSRFWLFRGAVRFLVTGK